MVNTKVRYMGLELKNPFIAGASSMTSKMEPLQRLEEAGAAAVVISSLFEEQIQLESFLLEEDLHKYDNLYSEMTSLFPEVKHAGPEEHLLWVRRAREALGIPVIASLNAVNRQTWVHYAGLLAQTGADALELNFYATPTSFEQTGAEIEKEQIEILKEIRGSVKLPISVKLSPFYTNPLHFIKQLDGIGVNGFVLFNRFFQPDLDVDGMKNLILHNLSSETAHRLPLRYAGLLHGKLKGDICSSSGIMTGKDAVKLILAGAACVQVVSTLFRNKVSRLTAMIRELEAWMDSKGHKDVDSFRGSMDNEHNPDPWVYTRAQYVRLLMKPEKIIGNVVGA